jgi:hypothetical protein
MGSVNSKKRAETHTGYRFENAESKHAFRDPWQAARNGIGVVERPTLAQKKSSTATLGRIVRSLLSKHRCDALTVAAKKSL